MSDTRRTFLKTIGVTGAALAGGSTAVSAAIDTDQSERRGAVDADQLERGDWVEATSRLNIRSGPGTQNEVLAVANPEERAVVVDTEPRWQYTWVKLSWPSLDDSDSYNLVGWSAASWVDQWDDALEPGDTGSLHTNYFPDRDNALIWATPHKYPEPVDTVEPGVGAEVLEGPVYESDGLTVFYKVAYGSEQDTEGWVAAHSIFRTR